MSNNWTDYIPWVYISLQVAISLIVSIMGAIFIKGEFKRQKYKMKQMELQINVKTQHSDDKAKDDPQQNKETYDTKEETAENTEATVTDKIEIKVEEETKETYEDQQMEKVKILSKIGFCKLYLMTVWKMRSVYGSLAVHAFDVLTDGLVIVNWWNYEKDVDVENVDARIMAWCGITVLLFHKLISVIAFWAKEGNLYRCLLQFFDVLIFEEIYISHKKILVQLSDKSEENDNDAIETTSTFKLVRNLEAIFESIPQSVLQLVFIMRTKWEEESEEGSIFLVISILSILQSIISMTNSILKNDNVYMTLPKWKPYKKRLPPTWLFIKHLLARLSEVVYRIGLFALFWSVCNRIILPLCKGLAFGVMLGFELLTLIILIAGYDKYKMDRDLNIEDICLRVQAIVIIPSEFVYEKKAWDIHFPGEFLDWLGCCPCMCCCTTARLLSTMCNIRKDTPYRHPTFRIGLSIIEWIFLIIWGLSLPERRKFLISFEYGLGVFIISAICFLIHTQYMYFFPNFALPAGVSIRSIYGYAFNGELEELQRLKPPRSFKKINIEWDDDNPANSKLPPEISKDSLLGLAFYGNEQAIKEKGAPTMEWNGETKYTGKVLTPIMMAMSNRQHQIVEYIKTQGMVGGQMMHNVELNVETARAYIKADYWDTPINNNKDKKQRHYWDFFETPVIYALSMGQYHVIDWLENEKGASVHKAVFNQQNKFKSLNLEFARSQFKNGARYFGDQ